MIDTLRLTRRGGDAARAREGGLERRALRRLPRRDRRARSRAALLPARLRGRRRRGRPDRRQGRDRDEGHPDDGRLEDPRGLRPGLRRDGDRALQGAGPARPRQDEHRRVRDGLVDGELRVRADAEPVGPDARARRLGRRLGRGGRGGSRPVGARLRHRRLDQAARRALRQRRASSDVRDRLALRRRRVRVEPRPDRPGRAERSRLRAPLLDHRGPRSPATRPPSSCRSAVQLPEARRPEGAARRRAARVQRARGDRARCARGRAARIELCRELGAEVGECSLPNSRRVRRAVLLPDRSRRGVVESRALRRCALRLPLAERRRPARDVRAHARRGLRRRAEAPDHDRHVRALGRLLRRVLRPGAEGAHGARPASTRRRSSASTSSSRRRRRRSRSSSARGRRIRSRCTSATCSRSRRAWRACRG